MDTRNRRGTTDSELRSGSVGPVEHAIRRVERVVGPERFCIMRVRRGDWEARTFNGRVGRGDTASDALFNLLTALGESIG
jgi:hypothetical protein